MESMNIGPTDPPTVAQEKASRLANRDTLAAWFRKNPLREISPDELEAMVGRNYQQRISDCRTKLGMTIVNVPRAVKDASGSVKRLSGAYRHQPTGESLGRDAGAYQPRREWDSGNPGPFYDDCDVDLVDADAGFVAEHAAQLIVGLKKERAVAVPPPPREEPALLELALERQIQMALRAMEMAGMTDGQKAFYEGKAAGVRQALNSVRYVAAAALPETPKDDARYYKAAWEGAVERAEIAEAALLVERGRDTPNEASEHPRPVGCPSQYYHMMTPQQGLNVTRAYLAGLAHGSSNVPAVERGRDEELKAVPIPDPKICWRCFHCGYIAVTAEQAAEHFGATRGSQATCQRETPKERHLMDVYDSLGVKWGDDVFAALAALRSPSADPKEPK